MRVAILGMGAVGHLMARGLRGHADVVRVDRWTAPLGVDVEPVDAILVTVKTPGTRWAAEMAARVLRPDGIAVTIQNGLGNAELLAERLGVERVARGVTYVGAQLFADGTLETTGPGRLEIGRPAAEAAQRALEVLVAALRAGGVTVHVHDSLADLVWRKLVVNCAVNPTTALLAVTHAQLLAHPTGCRLADALARETVRVASAVGVTLTEDFALAHWRETVASFSANPRSSMLQDVLAGRETEVDAINGAVAREGAARGVAAPLNAAAASLVTALHPAGEPAGWPRVTRSSADSGMTPVT